MGADQPFWQNEAKIFNDINVEFIDENGGRPRPSLLRKTRKSSKMFDVI
jgi:hypothetical protein